MFFPCKKIHPFCGACVVVARHHQHMRQGKQQSYKERSAGNNCRGSGRVCTSQAIDTNPSQITVAGQHCFYLWTESKLENQRQMNLPEDKYKQLQPYFNWNLSETCLLASAGTLKVIGGKGRKFHNKN
eukprot:15346804-Ditylum_brightwellii.AAC.2